MTELPHKRLLQIWKSPLIMMDCRARCHHPRRQQKIRRLVHLAGQVVPEHSSAAKDPGLFLSPSIFGSSCSDPFMIKPTISKRKLRLCFLFSANGCPSNLFRKKALSWLLQILRLPGCLQPGKAGKGKLAARKNKACSKESCVGRIGTSVYFGLDGPKILPGFPKATVEVVGIACVPLNFQVDN